MKRHITIQDLPGSGLFFFFAKDQRVPLTFSPEMSVWGIKESLAIIHQKGVVSPYFIFAPVGLLDKDTQTKVLGQIKIKHWFFWWLRKKYGRFNKTKAK